MEINVDVEINSPKSTVWSAITDIQNCANMISAIKSLKVLHEPDEGLIGLKWTETREMFGKPCDETMWITDCVEQEYYCVRAESHGAIYISKLSLVESNGKTILTMSFAGTSDSFWVRLLSSVMSLFMKKSMTKMLETDLQDIKKFVEAKQQ